MKKKTEIGLLDQLIALVVMPLGSASSPRAVRFGFVGGLIGLSVKLTVVGWWLRSAVPWTHPHKFYATIGFYFLWQLPAILSDVTVRANKASWYCDRDTPMWGATAKCPKCGEAHGLIPIRTHTYPAPGPMAPWRPPSYDPGLVIGSADADCNHKWKSENSRHTCLDCGRSIPCTHSSRKTENGIETCFCGFSRPVPPQ